MPWSFAASADSTFQKEIFDNKERRYVKDDNIYSRSEFDRTGSHSLENTLRKQQSTKDVPRSNSNVKFSTTPSQHEHGDHRSYEHRYDIVYVPCMFGGSAPIRRFRRYNLVSLLPG